MSEKEVKNRVVVLDNTGEVTRIKSDAEIVQENEDLEKSLKGPEKKEEPKLDPEVLAKLSKKSKKKEAKMEAVAKRDRSIYAYVIGSGQAGGRLCETFYKLGYDGCIFNTAQQDLEHIEMPTNNKVLLPGTLGGAGQSLDLGREAAENNVDLIQRVLEEKITDEHEMIFFCTSGAGGSGSGSSETFVNLLASFGKPINVIYVLPLQSEGAVAKHNAITTLGKMAKLAQSDVISSLVVVDNDRISLLYPNLSKADFWETANASIVEPIHAFNALSSQPTKHDSLDSMDYGKLLTCGDCQIYGIMKVYDYEDPTGLAEAALESFESSLLASDFELSEARSVGYLITGNADVLSKLPAANLGYFSHTLSETCDAPQIFSGVYESDSEEDCVKIFLTVSGMGLPAVRIQSLKKQAESQMAIMEKKESARASKMSVDYGGNETENKTKEIQRQIKQKKSGFNRLANNAGKKVVDRRKR